MRLTPLARGAAALALLAAARPARAQTLPVDDAVLRRIWSLGMDSSQVPTLLQALSDSIGPRLTGTPQMRAANEWAVANYTRWGIPARNEQVGTWRGWRRGTTHVDLVQPRTRTLDATVLAWSAGTKGRDVTAPVVVLPDVADSNALVRWLPQAKGKFVLVSMPERSCRPDDNLQQWLTPASLAAARAQRTADTAAWNARVRHTGYALSLGTGSLGRRLEQAGAAGVIASYWSRGWGVNKVFFARTETAPSLDVSCEDYGLLFRLADKGQGPVLRVRSDAEIGADVQTFNSVAEIKGSEKPNEYVVLSAHFDSWDSGSGTTDNGTGTVVMMEAMRILKTAYPRPKRTILVGHWASEEQGLNGSRAFTEDHPEVVRGLQALFNQDNGTGRIANVSPSGLVGAGEAWGRWASRLPSEISQFLNYSFPGSPAGGGSDNASFVCYGAPAFGLGSLGFDYGTYTWHTNRDTYDKVSLDDVKNNATLVAMLAYLASEDAQTVARDKRVLPPNATWPACVKAVRKWSDFTR